MRKKKSTRLPKVKITDAFVVLFCLAGIGTCIRYFLSDLNASLQQQNLVPVAYVTHKRRTAQRRFTDRVLWNRVGVDSPVYNGDYIHTAELSEATITFGDGGVVDLGENSFIQVFADSEGARVDLTAGNISVDAQTGALALHTGNTVVDVTGGALSAKSGDAGFNMDVGEGSVAVNWESLEEIIAASGARSVVVMVSPKVAPAMRLVTAGNDAVNVDFMWRRANWNPGDRVRIEIASDRDFRKINQRFFSEGDSAVLRLEGGMWFWRVLAVPKDSDEPTSLAMNNAVSGYLTVTPTLAPESLIPQDDAQFAYRSQLPAVRLQWNASDSLLGMTKRFLLEASNDESMTNPTMETTVDGTSLMVNTLTTGTWYWRVTPVLPKGTVAPPLNSQVRSFSIIQTQEIKPPVVMTPEDNTLMSLGNGTGYIRFSWKPEPEAATYNLRIADNAAMERPLADVAVTTNYHVYNIATGPLQARSYYWTVDQTGKDGAVSEPSRVYKLTFITGSTIMPLTPPDGQTVLDDDLPKLRFAWQRIGESKGEIRFQISSSPDFSTFATNEVVQGADYRSRVLAPGSYYWRIQLSDPASATVFSAVRTFLVSKTIVPRIILEYPATGQRLSAQAASQSSVALRWSTQNQQVGSARLVLSTNPDPFNSPLMDVRDPGQTVPLIPLRPGTYYWSIRASNDQGKDISAERPASFTVDPPPLFPAPRGLSPANNHRFDAEVLQTVQKIDFAWNSVDGANRYILTLYATDSGQRRRVFQTEPLASTAYTHTFTNLSQLMGRNFVWSIEAISTDPTSVSQRGQLGESSFVVVVPAPKVVIDAPGRLYGE